jgi:flagellar motor switch protein FliM
MSASTLTPSSVDRLIGTGNARLTPSTAARLELASYDWRRPARVSKDRLRLLEGMFERLVNSLGDWLTGRLRTPVETRLQSVEQYAFGEFALSLPMPCTSFIVDIAHDGQRGVIDIGPEISTYLVERFFGGDGSSSTLTRALTPIERMAVRGVADRIAQLVQEQFQDQIALQCSVSGFESSPEMLQPMPRDEPVLVANIEFSTGTVSSLVLLCLPFPMLDAFFAASAHPRATVQPTSDEERERLRQRSEHALRASRVSVAARLPDFSLTLRELASLEVGAVIPTGISKDARVTIRAGAQDRFVGHAGRVSGNLAIRILDAVHGTSDVVDA